MPNYERGSLKRNGSKQYEFFFDKRSLEFIDHYSTKTLTKNGSLRLSVYEHYWKNGDKFYKLANENYGNFRFWWIIALVNGVSSEADLTYGQTILIPISLQPFASII